MSVTEWTAQAMHDATLLRMLGDGVIKHNYSDPENKKWWVLAAIPEASPLWGMPVRAQPADRAELQVVQTKTQTTSGGPQERIMQLRGRMDETSGNKDEKNYVGTDEVWVATLRIQDNGHVELYPKGSAQPMMKVYKELLSVKTQGTKFDHDPGQMSFGQHSVNPLAQDMPSTNTIPVQSYTSSTSELLMIASLAIAAAKYINQEGLKNFTIRPGASSTSEIVPTQHLDYHDLLKGAE